MYERKHLYYNTVSFFMLPKVLKMGCLVTISPAPNVVTCESQQCDLSPPNIFLYIYIYIIYNLFFTQVSIICSPMSHSPGTSGKVFRSNVSDLSYLLSDNEAAYVQGYTEAYEERYPGHKAIDNPNLCYFLGDNPTHMKTWSATSGRVPTFRRNAASGKFWFPHHRRWMTNSEKPLSL